MPTASSTPPPDALNAAELSTLVAEHVAGWTDMSTHRFVKPDGPAWSEGIAPGTCNKMIVPPYATSADAVLPLLDTWQRIAKAKYRDGHIYWQAGTFDKQISCDYSVELCGMIGGTVAAQADTFPRAACLALLAAHGKSA